jgi:HK97 family phage major capsid protein
MSRISRHRSPLAFAALAFASLMDGIGTGPRMGRHFHTADPNGGTATADPPEKPAQGKAAEQRRAEFTKLHKEGTDLVAAAEKEGRGLTDDERKANEQRFARMQQIKELDEADAQFSAMVLRDVETGAGTVTTPRDPAGRKEFDRAEGRIVVGNSPEERNKRIREELNRFIRFGAEGQKFTLITTTGTSAMLPTRVEKPVVIVRERNPYRAALRARGLQVIESAGGEPIKVPILDDSGNTAYVIAQDATDENNLDPATSSLTLGANLYDSGTVWSSNTLLNTLDFDLLAFLQPMLDQRIDDKQASAWTTALIAATVGKTTASTTGVTYAELLDWKYSLTKQRRNNGVFIVSDGLFRVLEGLVDTTGRPLFRERISEDTPDTLLGFPIFVSEDLAAPAAAAVSGLFIDAMGMFIRDVRNRRIARYTNIPTHPDQFGLREFANGDMQFIAAAVRTLKHAAS